jgi:hypothetical protein
MLPWKLTPSRCSPDFLASAFYKSTCYHPGWFQSDGNLALRSGHRIPLSYFCLSKLANLNTVMEDAMGVGLLGGITNRVGARLESQSANVMEHQNNVADKIAAQDLG